jgi:hypothetical protein
VTFADITVSTIEELRMETNFLSGAIPIELVGLGDLGKSNGQKPQGSTSDISCLPS